MEDGHVSSRYSNYQDFLDNHQFSRAAIFRIEKIYGKNFISTGGLTTTKQICEHLDLEEGTKVLDVGCGTGGSAFYIAQTYGAHVFGIDYSRNMIDIAIERLKENQLDQVAFEVADATTVDFPENSFDVIYSRDTFLYVKDKLSVFKNLLKWLKPGGTLLITDYCCTEGTWSEDLTNLVKRFGFFLIPIAAYEKELEKAGFKDVHTEDITKISAEISRVEIEQIKNLREWFLKDGLTEDQYQDIFVKRWTGKLNRNLSGDQTWGLFLAHK